MAIAPVAGLPPEWGLRFALELAAIYEQAAGQLAAMAVRRLVRDRRFLTANARSSRALPVTASTLAIGLLLEVERTLRLLGPVVADRISAIIPKAYRIGVARANRSLSAIGFSAGPVPFDGSFHGAAAELLAADAANLGSDLSRAMGERFKIVLREAKVENAAQAKLIAQGKIAGRTRRQITKDILEKHFKDFKDKPLQITGKDGITRNYNAKSYVATVTRTKAMEAASMGTINRVREAGGDLVQISAHGATDGCGLYEGKIFSISGTHETYPPLNTIPNGGPPFHPNCRHTPLPFVEPLATSAEKRSGVIPSDRLGLSYSEAEKMAAKAA